jgi:hypothetical protein
MHNEIGDMHIPCISHAYMILVIELYVCFVKFNLFYTNFVIAAWMLITDMVWLNVLDKEMMLLLNMHGK